MTILILYTARKDDKTNLKTTKTKAQKHTHIQQYKKNQNRTKTTRKSHKTHNKKQSTVHYSYSYKSLKNTVPNKYTKKKTIPLII